MYMINQPQYISIYIYGGLFIIINFVLLNLKQI